MTPKILFSDNIHFSKNRFNSLFKFFDKYNISTYYETKNNHLKSCYGDYKFHRQTLKNEIYKIEHLSKEDLYNYTYKSINIFRLSKAELLSLLMTKENWYSQSISSDSYELFDKAYNENRFELINNMAASIYWINIWKDIFFKKENYSHCCVFSGSLIYVKSLQLLACNSMTKVIVIEDFFTGNDYYAEHKYSHIANNSDLKFNNYYQLLPDENSLGSINWVVSKHLAFKKLSESKNLNTKPSSNSYSLDFSNNNDNIVIIGQVINDFSIIETNINNICSLSFYKELIHKIITKTDYNVIFKSHPWERKKANLNQSLTFNELQIFVDENNYSSRVIIIEEYNLEHLFSQCKHIACLSSQGGIEAAALGYKILQFGDAFYGNKGFTYDINNINTFIKNINNYSNLLTISEYDKFQIFITKTLQFHLVSKKDVGVARLENIFSENGLFKITKSTLSKSTLSKYSHKYKKPIVTLIVKLLYSKNKLLKFQNDPVRFFNDSSHIFTRLLDKLY